MAINKNHEFEELDGVKCGIVEKNVSPARLAFLKSLLEFNGYTVMAVLSPAPKEAATAAPAAAAPAAAATTPSTASASAEEAAPAPAAPPAPETYTVGVTDYTFNPTNAIFGRSLKTPDGHIVTLAYWQQRETVSQDEIPYYERG
jgi:hypothetical protein